MIAIRHTIQRSVRSIHSSVQSHRYPFTSSLAHFSSSKSSPTPPLHDLYRGFPKTPTAIDFVPDSIKELDVYCFSPAPGVRQIVLNRPKVFNSLDLSMVRKLNSIIDGIQADRDVYLAVMTGAPSVKTLPNGQSKVTNVFCAGGDVKSLLLSGEKFVRANPPVRRPDTDLTRVFFREEYELDFKIANMSIPFVPILNGTTMGGGVGISVHSRFRAATPSTLFAMPECDLGFFPDVGGSYFLSHLPGGLGLFLALTGHRLHGYDLIHAGLATHFCSDHADNFLSEVMQTVGINAFQGSDAVEYLFARLDKPEVEPPFSLESQWDLIDTVFKYSSSVEEIVTELRRISTDSRQSEKIRNFFNSSRISIEKASPTMLKLTHQLLKRGSMMSLKQCLEQEYRATQVCMDGKDFYTGVHAKLIAKDLKSVPNWQPNKLSDVTDAAIQKYFAVPNTVQDRELELKLNYRNYQEKDWIS